MIHPPNAPQPVYRNAGNLPALALIPEQPGLALDIGCGAGDNARLLRAQGWTVDGLTRSEQEAQEAKVVCRQVWVHDLEQGLPANLSERYDLILCSHILEHLSEPAQLLQSLHRYLTPAGVLVVALPNLMHYRSRLPLVLGRFEYTEMGIMDRTHLRWFTFTSAQQLLHENGFVLELATVETSLPPGKLTRHFPPMLQAGMRSLLRAVSPGFFGLQLLYRARSVVAAQAGGA